MAPTARLAQPAERKALNLVVVGSSPTVGVFVLGEAFQTKIEGDRAENVSKRTDRTKIPRPGIEPGSSA